MKDFDVDRIIHLIVILNKQGDSVRIRKNMNDDFDNYGILHVVSKLFQFVLKIASLNVTVEYLKKSKFELLKVK